MNKDISTMLLTEDEIREKVHSLGAQISEDYEGKNPILICVLRGAFMFLADLIRNITVPMEIEFLSISSYGNEVKSSGEITIRSKIKRDLKDRHLIIVEDIVDSGLSIEYLENYLEKFEPESIAKCILLDKPEAHLKDFKIEYKGFHVGNEFLVGYGLDYAEKYRNLPYIGVLKKEIYS